MATPLAKNIRALMEEGKLTQRELARKTGLNRIHLNQILTGYRVSIRLNTQEKLARGLSELLKRPVTVADLWSGPQQKAPEPESLNDRTKKAQDFYRADYVPERVKKIVAEMTEMYRERAKKEREEGGKSSQGDSPPDI